MNIFTRTFVFAVAACLLTAIIAPAIAGDSRFTDRPLEIGDALAVSSHEELAALGVAKFKALADVLRRVTDEKTAREHCPAAERIYLELELITLRMRMLPPATPRELQVLQQRVGGFAEARDALDREVRRISAASPLQQHLRSVTFPLLGQYEQDAARRSRSLASLLQTVRSQIELYKLQHRDRPPDFRGNGWKQLTERTDANGAVVSTGNIGPYVRSVPRNPLNDASTILIVKSLPAPDFHYAKGDCGFVYEESSGKFFALDRDGRIFDEDAAHASIN